MACSSAALGVIPSYKRIGRTLVPYPLAIIKTDCVRMVIGDERATRGYNELSTYLVFLIQLEETRLQQTSLLAIALPDRHAPAALAADASENPTFPTDGYLPVVICFIQCIM